MPRIFPRPAESAVRVLKNICDDATNPPALRARSAELILNAYGLAAIPPDAEPRHRAIKRIAAARVKISSLDKEISARVLADRKKKQVEKRIDAVIKTFEKDAQE